LGTIGRDRAALVREDWMGRNQPLPAREKTKVNALAWPTQEQWTAEVFLQTQLGSQKATQYSKLTWGIRDHITLAPNKERSSRICHASTTMSPRNC
jgi:hypothetical protein